MHTIVAIALWALVLVTVIAVAKGRARRVPGLPYPQWYPIIGNLLTVLREFPRWSEYLSEETKRQGQCWTMGLPGSPPLLYLDDNPDLVEHILKTNFDNYVKGNTQRTVFDDLLGAGIFQTSGDVWWHQRKTASAMFTAKKLSGYMTGVLVRHGQEAVEQLTPFADRDEPVNLAQTFFTFTLASFSEMAFGEKLGRDDRGRAYSRAFDVAQSGINKRFFTPWWKLFRMLGIGEERRVAQALAVLNDYADEVIARREEELADVSETDFARMVRDGESCDVLSLGIASAKRRGVPLSRQDLTASIANFSIAGRDTTAVLLGHLVLCLGNHPEAMQRAVQEVQALHPNAGDTPTYETAKEMEFLHAAISETLRLYPSVPVDSKESLAADVLPDGVRVPAGTVCVYQPFSMGRSTRLWGPDALEWRPDRWLEMHETPSNYKFLAFNAGPRLCLGKPLAYLEAKLLMAQLLLAFEIDVLPGQTHDAPTTVTLPLRDGVNVRLRRRPPPAAL